MMNKKYNKKISIMVLILFMLTIIGPGTAVFAEDGGSNKELFLTRFGELNDIDFSKIDFSANKSETYIDFDVDEISASTQITAVTEDNKNMLELSALVEGQEYGVGLFINNSEIYIDINLIKEYLPLITGKLEADPDMEKLLEYILHNDVLKIDINKILDTMDMPAEERTQIENMMNYSNASLDMNKLNQLGNDLTAEMIMMLPEKVFKRGSENSVYLDITNDPLAVMHLVKELKSNPEPVAQIIQEIAIEIYGSFLPEEELNNIKAETINLIESIELLNVESLVKGSVLSGLDYSLRIELQDKELSRTEIRISDDENMFALKSDFHKKSNDEIVSSVELLLKIDSQDSGENINMNIEVVSRMGYGEINTGMNGVVTFGSFMGSGNILLRSESVMGYSERELDSVYQNIQRDGYGDITDILINIIAPEPVVVTDNSIKLEINGREIFTDVSPVFIEGRTLVPVRVVSEEFGAEIDWDGSINKVTITDAQGNIVEMYLNSIDAKVNGENVKLDVAPSFIDGRTMIPVRFITETFGAKVEWDGVGNRVIITN